MNKNTQVSDFVIRPITKRDLDPLLNFAKRSGLGFTSLIDDQSFLKKRIQTALDSFSGKQSRSKQFYLFVMEDQNTQKAIGCCGIRVMFGGASPAYHYKIGHITQTSERLQKKIDHEFLLPANHFDEATELCSLYLHPKYRCAKSGKTLSRARFLFMHAFEDRFSPTVMANLRGVVHADGQAPFWAALGQRFFQLSFLEAEKLRVLEGKQFISDLLPRHPIYVELLPSAARSVLGQVAQETKPAFEVLSQEGFQYRKNIDILDGGPLLECQRAQIKTIQQIRSGRVAQFSAAMDETTAAMGLISNQKLDFRLTHAPVSFLDENSVVFSEKTAKLLQVKIGDHVGVCLDE